MSPAARPPPLRSRSRSSSKAKGQCSRRSSGSTARCSRCRSAPRAATSKYGIKERRRVVVPAQAGTPFSIKKLDPRLRGDDFFRASLMRPGRGGAGCGLRRARDPEKRDQQHEEDGRAVEEVERREREGLLVDDPIQVRIALRALHAEAREQVERRAGLRTAGREVLDELRM